jgi:hypothetical protein
MDNLKKWRFFLKGGAHFDIKAESCTCKFNTETTEFHGYKLDGVEGPNILHIDINQIAVIIRL